MNARNPVGDDTVFSDYCFFVWTGKKKIQKQGVEADFLKTGEKISVFKQKRIPVDRALGVKISPVRKCYH